MPGSVFKTRHTPLRSNASKSYQATELVTCTGPPAVLPAVVAPLHVLRDRLEVVALVPQPAHEGVCQHAERLTERLELGLGLLARYAGPLSTWRSGCHSSTARLLLELSSFSDA
eukprot:scaffold20920_cov67-Phaeocystis_antarctica.AAC.3